MSTTTNSGSSNTGVSGGVPYGPGLSPQPGFSYRNVWKPLTISFIGIPEFQHVIESIAYIYTNWDKYMIQLSSLKFRQITKPFYCIFRRSDQRNIFRCYRPRRNTSCIWWLLYFIGLRISFGLRTVIVFANWSTWKWKGLR